GPVGVKLFDLVLDRVSDDPEHGPPDAEPGQPGPVPDRVQDEPDEQAEGEPLKGPPHAGAQLLQVVPEGHAAVPEEVLVVVAVAAGTEQVFEHWNAGAGGGQPRAEVPGGWG